MFKKSSASATEGNRVISTSAYFAIEVGQRLAGVVVAVDVPIKPQPAALAVQEQLAAIEEGLAC